MIDGVQFGVYGLWGFTYCIQFGMHCLRGLTYGVEYIVHVCLPGEGFGEGLAGEMEAIDESGSVSCSDADTWRRGRGLRFGIQGLKFGL